MENTAIIKNRPVAETLRAMKVGDVERFPIQQFNSVRNYQYGGMIVERVEGWRFSVKADPDTKQTVVTRLA